MLGVGVAAGMVNLALFLVGEGSDADAIVGGSEESNVRKRLFNNYQQKKKKKKERFFNNVTCVS
jgi:hypothetical protein